MKEVTWDTGAFRNLTVYGCRNLGNRLMMGCSEMSTITFPVVAVTVDLGGGGGVDEEEEAVSGKRVFENGRDLELEMKSADDGTRSRVLAGRHAVNACGFSCRLINLNMATVVGRRK